MRLNSLLPSRETGRLRRSSGGTDRWSWASAGGCCATITTPTTPFRRRFSVLARRAATVRDRDRLAAWLGRVARRIALRSREEAASRKALEGRRIERDMEAGEPPAAALVALETDAPVRAEVDRLPLLDRRLMRLTYWQGKSYKEAADATSLPIGTVRSRLARARERLRDRFSRLSLGSAGAAAMPTPSDALIVQTVRAASGFTGATKAATAVGAVPTTVAALVEGEFAMTTFFWKSITAAFLVGGAMSAAAVSLARRPPEPQPSPTAPVARPAPEGKKAESRSLLENGSVEEGEKDAPKGWSRGAKVPGVAYVWSRDTAHGGKASLCLKKTADRYFPIAQWSQTISRKGDAPRLKVSAWIKAETAGKAILDAQFIDGDGKWTHAWVSYIGAKKADDPPVTHDWKHYEGIVTIPPGTKQILIAPQIYGPGTVWFDDLKAEYTNAPASPSLHGFLMLATATNSRPAAPSSTTPWLVHHSGVQRLYTFIQRTQGSPPPRARWQFGGDEDRRKRANKAIYEAQAHRPHYEASAHGLNRLWSALFLPSFPPHGSSDHRSQGLAIGPPQNLSLQATVRSVSLVKSRRTNPTAAGDANALGDRRRGTGRSRNGVISARSKPTLQLSTKFYPSMI